MSTYKNPNSSRQNIFDSIYGDPAYNSFVPPKFPRIIDVELTNHCNMNCWFCCQQSMTRRKGFLSEELFQLIRNECSYWNSAIRFIRWGEPFLHRDIFKFIAMCRERTGYVIPTHVTTNGLLVNQEMADNIVNSGLDSIIFSFQGVETKGYSQMRNVSLGTAVKVYENLCRLVKVRGGREYPYIQATTTITDEHRLDVDTFINDLFNVGVDAVGVGKTNLHRVSNDKMKELMPRDTIYLEHFRCTEIYQKLSVDWDGKVSCCCGDSDNYMTIGDISRGEDCLYNLWWKSKKLKMIRELLKEKEHRSFALCKDCYLTHEWRKNNEG